MLSAQMTVGLLSPQFHLTRVASDPYSLSFVFSSSLPSLHSPLFPSADSSGMNVRPGRRALLGCLVFVRVAPILPVFICYLFCLLDHVKHPVSWHLLFLVPLFWEGTLLSSRWGTQPESNTVLFGGFLPTQSTDNKNQCPGGDHGNTKSANLWLLRQPWNRMFPMYRRNVTGLGPVDTEVWWDGTSGDLCSSWSGTSPFGQPVKQGGGDIVFWSSCFLWIL